MSDLYDPPMLEPPRDSILSRFSLPCFLTDSEASTFSESADDNSCSSEPSSPSFQDKQGIKQYKNVVDNNNKLDGQKQDDSEVEMMKQRFAKLLLGEDVSGSGKGVCTAVTISNSITNLYATVFGQNLRLEPLNPEKKTMWKRELSCLLSVCDYIVEIYTEQQTLPTGKTVQVMKSRERSDIYVYLPALQKLDMMLLDILDSFHEKEFRYVENANVSSSSSSARSRHGSFRRISQRKEAEKWWMPVPRVPSGGLSNKSRNHLRNKSDCANQIHKAVMAINSTILDEMEIPIEYLTTLPKSGRATVGEKMYRTMAASDKFCPNSLLDSLNIGSEHEALEVADRVEASMYSWRKRACLSHSESSWKSVKELVAKSGRSDKNVVLAERAERLILCLKKRFPELSQTTLDISKIQLNKDVGQAILESYSRVLEGLSYNIVAWIEDVLHADRVCGKSRRVGEITN